MNVIYFGTPDWAIPPLAGLVSKGFQVSMVVTQPDRLTGRKKILTPCAVKSFALQKNLSVFSPNKIKDLDVFSQIKKQNPDINTVYAYGQIFRLLDLPRFVVLIFTFLLPKFREQVRLSFHLGWRFNYWNLNTKMVMKLDAGPILSESSSQILGSDASKTWGKAFIHSQNLLRLH